MATIKSYTSLEQSKKLAEILPLESADMCLTFVNNVWNPVWGKADYIYQLQKDCYEPDYTKNEYIDIDEFEPKVVPCWSLAALLNVIPKHIGEFNALRIDISDDFAIWYDEIGSGVNNDLPDITRESAVDACYEFILQLHKLKLL